MESEDPGDVRSVAVTVDDVLAAFEANRQRDAGAVLRITPPFASRMRARLHRTADDGEVAPTGDPAPIHVDPKRLLETAAVEAYPSPDETGERLRDDPDETYTRDRHREYHAAAVADWREDARDAVVDSVVLDTPEGPTEVTVKALG